MSSNSSAARKIRLPRNTKNIAKIEYHIFKTLKLNRKIVHYITFTRRSYRLLMAPPKTMEGRSSGPHSPFCKKSRQCACSCRCDRQGNTFYKLGALFHKAKGKPGL